MKKTNDMINTQYKYINVKQQTILNARIQYIVNVHISIDLEISIRLSKGGICAILNKSPAINKIFIKYYVVIKPAAHIAHNLSIGIYRNSLRNVRNNIICGRNWTKYII